MYYAAFLFNGDSYSLLRRPDGAFRFPTTLEVYQYLDALYPEPVSCVVERFSDDVALPSLDLSGNGMAYVKSGSSPLVSPSELEWIRSYLYANGLTTRRLAIGHFSFLNALSRQSFGRLSDEERRFLSSFPLAYDCVAFGDEGGPR